MRTEQGLSQEALGLATGHGRTFVSQLERGERGASLKTFFSLASYLEVAPSAFVAQMERELRSVSSGRRWGQLASCLVSRSSQSCSKRSISFDASRLVSAFDESTWRLTAPDV